MIEYFVSRDCGVTALPVMLRVSLVGGEIKDCSKLDLVLNKCVRVQPSIRSLDQDHNNLGCWNPSAS
jgi:hypothetical protein